MIEASREIRKHILGVSKRSGHGHIPSSFSIVEILLAVYGVMKHDPANPRWEERDLFILSKAHAALALYCVLAGEGYFELEGVNSFGGYLSNFGCHGDRLKIPGIEVSTGSLGHGIGVAVGIALGCRIDGGSQRVFVLIGDGEANEGSVWEAVMVASDLGLKNLTVIYDNNMSHSRGLQIPNPAERFRAFGSYVTEVDGHSMDELEKALAYRADSLHTIVAHTVKGQGCKSFTDNHYAWHRRSPGEEEYRQLIEELDETSI